MAMQGASERLQEPPVLPTVVIVDGVPALVTDFLSPKDTYGEIDDRIHGYLRAGLPQVWAARPYDRTVTVYRPDAPPQMFIADQEMAAGPDVIGRVPARSR